MDGRVIISVYLGVLWLFHALANASETSSDLILLHVVSDFLGHWGTTVDYWALMLTNGAQ